jgi:hypothetical protein
MPLPYPSIHPQLSEAHDPHFILDSLIDQLCAYIINADTCPHMSPVQKAGVLYLTLVEAYERCGMMQKEHAPDLLLAHGGEDCEVRSQFLLPEYCENSPTRPQVLLAASIDAEPSKRRSPEQQNAINAVYLAAIEAAMVSDACPHHDESTSPLHSGEAIASVETVTPEDRPAKASSSEWVKHCLERLDHLEVAQTNLSTAVNWAYFRLGEAWYDFCCVRIELCSGLRNGLKANIHCLALQTYVQADCWLSRASQSQCLKHLATILPDQSVSGALRKRLVRAKKYWSLVHRYSTRLLSLVPVVCVSRVDVVPLSLLSTPSTP